MGLWEGEIWWGSNFEKFSKYSTPLCGRMGGKESIIAIIKQQAPGLLIPEPIAKQGTSAAFLSRRAGKLNTWAQTHSTGAVNFKWFVFGVISGLSNLEPKNSATNGLRGSASELPSWREENVGLAPNVIQGLFSFSFPRPTSQAQKIFSRYKPRHRYLARPTQTS